MMPVSAKLDDAVTGLGVLPAVGRLDPLQGANDCQNLGRESLQSGNDFDVLQRCSIAEGYAENRLSVILDLGPKGDLPPVGIRSGKGNGEIGSQPVFVLQFDAVNPDDGEHRNQEIVFVVNVEIMQGANIGIPSLVTFHAINNEIEEGRRGRYFSAFRERGFKLMPVFVDREFGPSRVGLRENRSNRGAPCDIKSAVEIVNCIANHQGDIGAQFPVSKAVVEELFPRLAIDVQAGSLSVSRGSESLLDIRDVLVGPFDF